MLGTIEIKEEYTFCDLQDAVWDRAVDTLNKISNANKEDEFMQFLNDYFLNEAVDLTRLNDFLRYEDDFILKTLGINDEQE